MPVINKTRSQFLVLPVPSWFPVAPFPYPFTAGNLQEVLDAIEDFVLGDSAWSAIKAILFGMDLSSFTSPESFASVIDSYCASNNLSAWAVEEPQ